MNKKYLKKLTKAQLIRLFLKQEKNRQAQKPSNSIKQMVNEYKDIRHNSTPRTIQSCIQANSTTQNGKMEKRKTQTHSTKEC